jgi:hypothetical protein
MNSALRSSSGYEDKMSKTSQALARCWSVTAVIVILGLVLLGFLRSELGHGFASILCLALLTHSWLIQRSYTRTSQRLVFLTLVLCLPALASFWLGLNVIRFYSYDPEPGPDVYTVVILLQNIIEWCTAAVGVAVLLWAIVELARWLAKRVSA